MFSFCSAKICVCIDSAPCRVDIPPPPCYNRFKIYRLQVLYEKGKTDAPKEIRIRARGCTI